MFNAGLGELGEKSLASGIGAKAKYSIYIDRYLRWWRRENS